MMEKLALSRFINIWKIIHSFPIYKSLIVPTRFNMIIVFCFSLFIGYFLKMFENYKLSKYFIGFITIYILLFNLIKVNSYFFKDSFTIKPYRYKTEMNFYQEINEGMDKDNAPPSELYPYFLRNIGTINCYEKTHLNIHARPKQDSNYISEAYYSKSLNPAEIIYFSPNRMRIKVDIDDNDMLIINQNYGPGWKAKDRSVISYNGLISTKVCPEDSIIEFYYRPYSFTFGLYISLASLLCILFFTIPRKSIEKLRNEKKYKKV